MDPLDAMQAMFACIAYLESEAMAQGLDGVARFMRLGLVELQAQFRVQEERQAAEANAPRQQQVR